ncbi:MAG: glutathione S-transferase N-terminal domain-containing protein, partial [Pseudomonadales bacterium]|nr:glutathione S-transferase N-terminal domain-containing protein [Pseudomonadales bacterium]
MTIKLYRHPLSGHSHRAELMLSLLGLQAELIDVDLLNGAHKKPEFLALNSFGQVPVLDDNGTVISDSNGILVYLARRYDKDYRWFPLHPAVQAEVQRFLSVAAGPVAFGPAAARLVNVFGAGLNHQEAIDRAEQILESLNEVLAERQWLAGDLTIA